MKRKSEPQPQPTMTLFEAETYLRKVGEWHGVVKMNRETIIKWAEFLRAKGIKN